MKRIHILAIITAILASCTTEAPVATENDGQYEMRFIATTSGMSRADVDGICNMETYPVNKLYLTAYHIDLANERQYYFIDQELNYDGVNSLWTLPDWYWPIQGDMSFLGYWCPKFSRQPGFDVVADANGNTMPRMTVDATSLDGKSDFLYLSNAGISCPEIGTTTLRYLHGLTWLTIGLRAEVMDDGQTSADPTKTQDLIEHLEIHKIVIEDCARKGIATVVPGIGATSIGSTNIDINWKSYNDSDPNNVIDYHQDQIYYRKATDDPDDITSYEWSEVPDGSVVNDGQNEPQTSFRISAETQQLGVYGENDKTTSTFLHEGILIIPENKTSITIDYTVTDEHGKKNHKVERYVLRDNNVAWLPGFHYNYEIVFRNYDDYDTNFEVIPSWGGITLSFFNYCYFGIGSLNQKDGATQLNAGFLIEPVHDGGSATSDDMDYHEGERAF